MSTHLSSNAVWLLLLLIVPLCQLTRVIIEDIPSPDKCETDEFFNTASLTCIPCGANFTSTADGVSCECKPGFKKTRQVGSRPYQINLVDQEIDVFTCQQCAADEEVTPDGWDCVKCFDDDVTDDTSVSIDPETLQCAPDQCIPGGNKVQPYLQYRSASGQLATDSTPTCPECASFFKADPSASRCIRCSSDFQFLGFDNCDCGDGENSIGQGRLCLPTESNIVETNDNSEFNIFYQEENQQPTVSPLLENTLLPKLYNCTYYKDIPSCQVFLNYCALTMYAGLEGDDATTTDKTSACTMYQRYQSVEDNGNIDGYTMPPFKWSDPDILNINQFSDDYTMGTGSNSDWFRVVAYKYALDGTYMGLVEVWKNGEFQLCKDGQYSLQLAYKFGKQYERTCNLRVRSLVDDVTTYFYEPYIQFTDNGQEKLYALPVVLNRIRDNPSTSNDAFRRFFLVDNVSGKDENGEGGGEILGSYVSNILLFYAKEELATGEKANVYIALEYSPITKSDYDQDNTVETKWRSLFRQKYKNFNRSIGICVGLFGGLVIFWSFFKINSWRKRAGGFTIDLFSILKFIIYWFGLSADVFFLILFFASFYLLFSWRNQNTLFILLPVSVKSVEPFTIYLSTTVILKIVEIIHFVTSQCMIDIFFIDWERPKEGGNKMSADGKSVGTGSSVSIWRTYFVANEWNEIQTIRKTNVFFQLMASLFFLEVLNFKEYGRSDPSNDLFPNDQYFNSPYNPMLRFAIGCSVYIGIGLLQFIFEVLFYSRFIEDPFNQFVDLCSISNISAFIMSQKLYGYYIHGRSVHGFADANLAQLALLMQKEQDDLRGTRGLLPDSDIQVFEMSLPRNLRIAYRKLFSPPAPSLASKAAAASRDQPDAAGGALAQLDPQTRKSIEGYNQLNQFLAAFINRNIPDCDFEVRDRPFLEKILDTEFQEVSDTRGIFYNNDSHAFDKVLFYGNEMTLFLFDVILFGWLDNRLENFVLAAIFVYIVQQGIVKLRSTLGQINLAKKTLVDERFLI